MWLVGRIVWLRLSGGLAERDGQFGVGVGHGSHKVQNQSAGSTNAEVSTLLASAKDGR